MSSLAELRKAQIAELESSNVLNQRQASAIPWQVFAAMAVGVAAVFGAGATVGGFIVSVLIHH